MKIKAFRTHLTACLEVAVQRGTQTGVDLVPLRAGAQEGGRHQMSAGRARTGALQPRMRRQVVDGQPSLRIVRQQALDEPLRRIGHSSPCRVPEVERSILDARLDLDEGHLTTVGLVGRLSGQHRVLQTKRKHHQRH